MDPLLGCQQKKYLGFPEIILAYPVPRPATALPVAVAISAKQAFALDGAAPVGAVEVRALGPTVQPPALPLSAPVCSQGRLDGEHVKLKPGALSDRVVHPLFRL